MKGPRAKGLKERKLVLLKDLAPTRDPLGGGAAKPVFGEGSVPTRPDASAPIRKSPGKKK